MVVLNELQVLLEQNSGTITAAQANAIGISNERLRLLVYAGKLERAAHGVYVFPDDFPDKMYVAQIRRPKMIYSHETALFLHELTDRDPISYSVTVPTGYNAKAIIADGISVYSIKREVHLLGIVQMETMFGNTVNVYGIERTICDCIRNRNKMDIAVATDAVKKYVKRNDKDLNTLMEMAEVFRVTKILRNYMEVLL
ncbi:type IV toxin-antitoxin system AbiEi family antitoxin domain-containing protein [Anaerosporobacter sp.]|uniref:type IV toxin-antitoxin system AbiEi family antitoxin domain-containing protein n=1 Tax=Anaerosporobacter sp. TaxID=1872529 RepID=UPI00286F1CED|nr:type IV toxin-antitoxin system AbiEi family antitoxin domain-containing protein [Anaerosporobacter sp.]